LSPTVSFFFVSSSRLLSQGFRNRLKQTLQTDHPDLFTQIPESRFRLDASSTDLRAARAGDAGRAAAAGEASGYV
jgi:hypothetical protein